MRATIRLFALAKQRAGRPQVELDLPEPATVADLKRALGAAVPSLAPLLPNLLIAVDAEYAADDRPIPPGAELAVIPPVSGGGSEAKPAKNRGPSWSRSPTDRSTTPP
ncbi:MAG: MoaD/ThiS family protein [Isosphaeraceae bacterium]|nr:MoaD/ThiS family protein [Isosphaeraceae bacterium]